MLIRGLRWIISMGEFGILQNRILKSPLDHAVMLPKNIKIAGVLGEFNEEYVDHNMLFMIMT